MGCLLQIFFMTSMSVIIDSYAHYNSSAYTKPFRYLSYDENGFPLKESDRESLLQEFPDNSDKLTKKRKQSFLFFKHYQSEYDPAWAHLTITVVPHSI